MFNGRSAICCDTLRDAGDVSYQSLGGRRDNMTVADDLVNINILAGLWLDCISSVEITLFLMADILLQHRALFQC